MSLIDSNEVVELFKRCLLRKTEVNEKGDPIGEHFIVEGIQPKLMFAFHPGRVAEVKGRIKAILENLPEQFRRDIGGGWSFLNLCVDKNKEQWTGLHHVCEHLLVLGIATDQMAFTSPREFWPMLPGGLPYVCVTI
ncbi:hypothetical protein D3C81_900880 [compost metagenome]